MSATNTTTTYQLPIFVGSDVPSWLTDWNGAMTDIDTAIAAAKTTADGAALTAGNASSGVTTNANAITALQTTVGNHTTAISNNAGSINTINSLIGNGVPTTTDQTIIGAINEINAAYKDAANISFDNTGTSMVATTVQAAIVEAYNNGGGSTPTAAQVTYDNSTSGLAATDVQAAIDELAGASSEVSVVGDGSKTYAQIMAALFALVDTTKVTGNTVLQTVMSNGTNNYVISQYSATELVFNFTIGDPSGFTTQVFKLNTSGAAIQLGQTTSGNSVTDISANSASTNTYKVIY